MAIAVASRQFSVDYFRFLSFADVCLDHGHDDLANFFLKIAEEKKQIAKSCMDFMIKIDDPAHEIFLINNVGRPIHTINEVFLTTLNSQMDEYSFMLPSLVTRLELAGLNDLAKEFSKIMEANKKIFFALQKKHDQCLGVSSIRKLEKS